MAADSSSLAAGFFLLVLPCGTSDRCITLAAHLRPSHSTQRHNKPSGYIVAPLFLRSFPFVSVFIVPRPRNMHTAVAIKLPCIPCGKSARGITLAVNLPVALSLRHIFARASPHCGKQTLGVSRGLPRRSPSGRRRARPYPSHKSHSSHNSHASAPPPQPVHHRRHPKILKKRLHTHAAHTLIYACIRACALGCFFAKKTQFSAQNDLTKLFWMIYYVSFCAP